MPDLKKLNLYVPALRFHEIMLITMKITRHLFISYFSYQFFKNIHLRLKAIEILENENFDVICFFLNQGILNKEHN